MVPFLKRFFGKRTVNGCEVTVRDGDDAYALNPRFDLRQHSPTGFEWGYSGSGPAQLSLAILADVLRDTERAEGLYQDFKFAVVARMSGDEWTLSEEDIREAVAAIESRRGHRR
jgi:Family of unknown function (DUF6166)